MTIAASCHCGAIQLEMGNAPSTLTQCTCSVCRRYGAQWAYCTRKTARIICSTEALGRYVRHAKGLSFCFCNNCGCLTHYEDLDMSNDARIAVNAKMIAPEDVAGIKVRTFDGADAWQYLDE